MNTSTLVGFIILKVNMASHVHLFLEVHLYIMNTKQADVVSLEQTMVVELG